MYVCICGAAVWSVERPQYDDDVWSVWSVERVCMYAYVEPLYGVWSVLSMMMMYGVWSVYGVRRTLSGVNLVAHVIRVQQPSEDVVHRGGVVRLRPCRHRRRRRDRRLRCQLRL